MTKKAAITVLQTFNRWRRGDEPEHPSPRQIGLAIDTAVKHLKASVKAGQVAKKKAAKKPKLKEKD